MIKLYLIRHGETEWNTVAWGPIQLPNAVLTEKTESYHD